MLKDYISVIMATKDPFQEFTQKAMRHLQASTAEYELVLLNRNREWTTATIINQGLKAAVGEYILFLCDDCFVDPDTLEKLLRVLQKDEKIGMVGPTMYSPEGESKMVMGTLICTVTPSAKTVQQGVITVRLEEADLLITPNDMGHVTGACMMFRRSLVEEIGGYDERCITGGGDIDFCFRAREKGYRVVWVEDTKAVHIAGATREQDKDYLNSQVDSTILTFQMWGGSKFIQKEVKEDGTTVYTWRLLGDLRK